MGGLHDKGGSLRLLGIPCVVPEEGPYPCLPVKGDPGFQQAIYRPPIMSIMELDPHGSQCFPRDRYKWQFRLSISSGWAAVNAMSFYRLRRFAGAAWSSQPSHDPLASLLITALNTVYFMIPIPERKRCRRVGYKALWYSIGA